MTRRWGLLILLVVGTTIVAIECNKNNSPTQPQQTPGPQLNAVPSSALVGAGGSENIAVSGGIPPYSIASPPGSIATAQLLNPDSIVTTLKITGVSVASVSTAVVIRDSAAAKTVRIPITVR